MDTSPETQTIGFSNHRDRDNFVRIGKRQELVGQAYHAALADCDVALVVQHAKMPDILRRRLRMDFDFQRIHHAVFMDQQIDFPLDGVTQKVEISFFAGIGIALQDFGEHEAFEKVSVHGADAEYFRSEPAGQPGG